jgi:hypothetical protein
MQVIKVVVLVKNDNGRLVNQEKESIEGGNEKVQKMQSCFVRR